MKASWWKYVLLALLTAGIVACGKDNKAANNGEITTANPLTNGVSTAVTSSSYEEFRQQVVNGQFVTQQYSAVTYYFVDVYYSSQNNNCSSWWIFSACSSSQQTSGSFMRRYDKVNNFTEHEYGNDINAVHGQLVSIVNSPAGTFGTNGTRQISSTAWEVRNSSGAYYVIDVAQPIVANPVFYRPANVQNEDGYAYSYRMINVF